MTHFCGLIRFYHLKIVIFFPRFYSILTVSPHKVALTLFSDLSNKVMSLLDTWAQFIHQEINHKCMVLFSLGSPPKLVLIWWFHILLCISQTYITTVQLLTTMYLNNNIHIWRKFSQHYWAFSTVKEKSAFSTAHSLMYQWVWNLACESAQTLPIKH